MNAKEYSKLRSLLRMIGAKACPTCREPNPNRRRVIGNIFAERLCPDAFHQKRNKSQKAAEN